MTDWGNFPIDLNPESVAEQLGDETGDDWNVQMVLDAYSRLDHETIREKARDAVLDLLVGGE